MKQYMKQGWRLTMKHSHILIVLFLYQLLYGFFLYRFINSVVVPLLHRYPGNLPSEYSANLFWAESEFQLIKTDLIHPYLWTLLIIAILRLTVSPLLNAGLFFSLHHVSQHADENSRFTEGIRRKWKPMLLYCWTGTIMAVAPAFWLLPPALGALINSGPSHELVLKLLPWGTGWLLWIVFLHIITLSLQFGSANGLKASSSISRILKSFLPMLLLTLTLWVITGAVGMVATGVEMVWAGILALILHQAYYLVRTIFRVWTVASQYASWESH